MITQEYSFMVDQYAGDLTLPEDVYFQKDSSGPEFCIEVGFDIDGHDDIGVSFINAQVYCNDEPISFEDLEKRFGYTKENIDDLIRKEENGDSYDRVMKCIAKEHAEMYAFYRS